MAKQPSATAVVIFHGTGSCDNSGTVPHVRGALRCTLGFGLLVGVLCTSVVAQDAPTKLEKIKKAQALEGRVFKAFRDKKFEEATKACHELLELFPDHAPTHYNLSCALARLKKNDEAIAALTKAIEHGYDDARHMQKDEDLADLRTDKRFPNLVTKAQENRKMALERLPIEKSKDLPGLKTIEANPEDGLRYRLRVSEKATVEKPHRLIVWLHPSGGSMDNVIERLAPQFAEHGFALVVFTQKQYGGWTEDEGVRLLEKTLPDIARHKVVQAKRPVLLGFSAGGQMALELWYADPLRWGGLVLDAAYPVKMQDGKYVPRDLPDNEAIQKTPFFVLVGAKDGGSGLWKKVTPKWREAKVPLTIRHIEGKQHEWLFGKAEITLLSQWLDDIAAGKLPQDAAKEK